MMTEEGQKTTIRIIEIGKNPGSLRAGLSKIQQWYPRAEWHMNDQGNILRQGELIFLSKKALDESTLGQDNFGIKMTIKNNEKCILRYVSKALPTKILKISCEDFLKMTNKEFIHANELIEL